MSFKKQHETICSPADYANSFSTNAPLPTKRSTTCQPKGAETSTDYSSSSRTPSLATTPLTTYFSSTHFFFVLELGGSKLHSECVISYQQMRSKVLFCTIRYWKGSLRRRLRPASAKDLILRMCIYPHHSNLHYSRHTFKVLKEVWMDLREGHEDRSGDGSERKGTGYSNNENQMPLYLKN